MKLKFSKTNRGFQLIEFHDRYGMKCSIQESSLATEEAIWFGVSDPEPRCLINGAWTPVELPDDTVISSRMHLTREQVKALIPILQVFVLTGFPRIDEFCGEADLTPENH